MQTHLDEMEPDELEVQDVDTGDTPELDRLRLLANQAKANFGLILLADRKAQFLLRTALGLLGIAFIALPPAIITIKKELSASNHASAFMVVMILCGVTAGCLLYAIANVVQAVRPRVNDSEMAHSELFFGAVARQSPEEFRQIVNTMTHQRAVDDLAAQVYNSALIAQAKYASIDKATTWMLLGGSIGVIFAACVLLFYGVMADSVT